MSAARITDKIESADTFARDIIMELLRTGVRNNLAEDPQRVEAEGVCFREVLARMNFETRTVNVTDFDVGAINEGCLNLAILALKFGIFLAWSGIELTHEGYFHRSDH